MPDENQSPISSSVSQGQIVAVVLVYAVCAASWILVSDEVLHWFFTDPDQIMLASMLKGWAYVAITSLLLYALMWRWFASKHTPKVNLPNARHLRLPLALLIGGIVVLMAISVYHALQQHELEELSRIKTVASLKSRQIDDWLKERRSDADFIQTSEFFIEQYKRWQVGGDVQGAEHLQTRLEKFSKNRGFSATSLFAPDGTALWHSQNAPASILPELTAVIRLASSSHQVQFVNPYRDSAGKVWLDFVAPLTAHQTVAPPLIVLHIDLADWLYPALASWPVTSTSGETLLLRREADDLLYLNPVRFRPDAPLTWRVPLAKPNLLCAYPFLFADRFGVELAGIDYHDAPALGVAQPIQGTDWVLLAKLDKIEMYQTAKREVVWIACVGILTIFVACAGFYLLHQREGLAMVQAIQKSQAERLRAHHLLSAISDLSTDAIFAKDLDGRYILFNTAASNFVGKAVEEVLGQGDTAIFPQEQAQRVMAFGRRVITENITLTGEETLDTISGPRVFLATKGPLRDVDGKVVGLFGISRDITERKHAESALRESEARFRGLVEQSLAGIYIIQDGQFVYVNPGFAAIFGYDKPEDVAGCIGLLDLVNPGDRERVAENLRQRLDGEIRDYQYRFQGVHRLGHNIELEVHGRRFDYQQRPAVIGFLLDISSRKATEDALKRQTEELKIRNEELERFNQAMVGRELDMIKLKQQINQLSLELGRMEPYSSTIFSGDKLPDDSQPG